ncbi:hypothetical protein Tsubulata_024678 [Turnera subulata]|uniref:Aldehyde oxidase GLOX n=1 Tax=Turnera subulata TaxID=218843 RepID=A0A9Q0G7W6_9ROSI|nr:hypothetical protein Tsubulata_024678 [Turnera subulata]
MQPAFFLFLLLQLLFATQETHKILTHAGGGRWELMQKSIGISAMHMQLLHTDRVITYDRTDFGASNLSLPQGKCRHDPNDKVLTVDCTAHSVEYDVTTNTFRPLMVQTDLWCSSGAVTPDGSLVQTGGWQDGRYKVRVFSPCNDSSCDWVEVGDGLKEDRWYSTNHILPDGRQIIVGGIDKYNYEFYPKTTASGVYDLPFLKETFHANVYENNLYPFVLLNVDGNLFIFANNRAILFDYVNQTVVKNYPTIPGGDPRNYPSTGSAVLLPLKNLQSGAIEAEVLICGGARENSSSLVDKGVFIPALDTCGRIKITDPNPTWAMETMPYPRVMGDMTLLPNGNVLIINGAGSGTARWEMGRDPVLHPVLYRPDKENGTRFLSKNPTTIPRMYHSTAILVRDGRVLVGGSNPHEHYNFTGVLFPTELSLEAFSPSYLDAEYDTMRPKIVSPLSTANIGYGQKLNVTFQVKGKLDRDEVSVTMVAPSFTTHSFAMNHRLLVLGNEAVTDIENGDVSTFEVHVTTPPSNIIAPSGYYMLFVVHRSIPSEGIWVKIM